MSLELILSLCSLGATVVGVSGTMLVTQARVERLEKDVERLDASKATKESLDSLRAHIDLRFDHLERLLRERTDGPR